MVVKTENVLYKPRNRGDPVKEEKRQYSSGNQILNKSTFYIVSVEDGKLHPIAKALEFEAGVDFASREALAEKYPMQMHMDGSTENPEITILVSFTDEGKRIMHS